MDLDRMRFLVDLLNTYTKEYDEGHPLVSDKEWDDQYFELQKMEQESGIVLGNSPTAHISYTVVNKLNKVTHDHPMLSLQKTKSEDEVVSFLGLHEGIAMAKMDGLTCSLTYENGKLVRAETRGNGLVGEDITHNIFFVKGVPQVIPITDKFIVDGEVICNYMDFQEFSQEYKNPRNFASGSIRLLDSRVSAQRKLTFVAWDCITGLNCKTLSEKLNELDELGFIVVTFGTIPVNSMVHDAIKVIKDMVEEEYYPIDGIVFKYNDCAYYNSLGATEHHFRGGIAYKFYDERYETKLVNIEWSMGKTGVLTPIAVFDPVDDGDSIITKASLHNLNIMRQILGETPYEREKIWVAKMNMIIPQVMKAEKRSKLSDYIHYTPPTTCPYCGAPTKIDEDFLYCTNPQCEGKLINKLDHFVGKKGLDIKGLSKATLEKLITWGWVSKIEDLFNLEQYRAEWINQPGFGAKSVDNILTTIAAARNCELWQFISALSIPLIGSTYAKQIAKAYTTWDGFRYDIDCNYDFTKWDGFGPEIDYSLINFNYTEADLLAKEYLIITNSLINSTVEKSSLMGKTIVITGKLNNFKNRGLLQEEIEKHGGKVGSSVTSKTDYLVNNDINSGSSKNATAKKLGIPIITEEQLIAMF